MNKQEMKKSIQDGFSELSPDIFASILEVAEKENLVQWNMKSDPSKEDAEYQDLENFDINRISSEHRTNVLRRFSKYALSACACLALICMYIIGISGKDQNEMCLLLNINPSLKVVMNESCQIKDVQGLNEDGVMIAEKLMWNQKESVFDLLDHVLQDTADASYLSEDGGILVTICVSDPDVYEDLENKIGKSIDRKLDEMEIPDVITAFQQGTEDLSEDGRTHLETELADQYGADLSQIQQMSVVDLIRYCRKNTSMDLKLSPHSDQRWNEISKQKKEALNERNEIENEIENDVENEMSQKTEEADVNSESEDVQDVPEEDTETAEEDAASESKTFEDNAEETDAGTNVLPEYAPASSEVPDSSPADHEANQDQTSGNGEDQKDDLEQKKNKENKKKENKKKKNKKTKDKDNKKQKNKNKDKKDKEKKNKDNKDKKKKSTDSRKKKEDTKKRNADGTSDTKKKQDKKTQNDNDKVRDKNKSDGTEKKGHGTTGKK